MATLLRDTGQIMTTSRSFSPFYQIVSSIALGEVQYEYHIIYFIAVDHQSPKM